LFYAKLRKKAKAKAAKPSVSASLSARFRSVLVPVSLIFYKRSRRISAENERRAAQKPNDVVIFDKKSRYRKKRRMRVSDSRDKQSGDEQSQKDRGQNRIENYFFFHTQKLP
jgi:hypothetical protein